jgi:hypothetical protein
MNNFIFDLWGGWMAVTQNVWLLFIPIAAIYATVMTIKKK